MNRRDLLLACLFLQRAAADERDDVLQVFVPLASALSIGDAEAFMKPIDPKMEGFEQLRQNVYGLIAQFEIKSSIELMRVENGLAELDWYMELAEGTPPAARNSAERQSRPGSKRSASSPSSLLISSLPLRFSCSPLSPRARSTRDNRSIHLRSAARPLPAPTYECIFCSSTRKAGSRSRVDLITSSHSALSSTFPSQWKTL